MSTHHSWNDFLVRRKIINNGKDVFKRITFTYCRFGRNTYSNMENKWIFNKILGVCLSCDPAGHVSEENDICMSKEMCTAMYTATFSQ